MCMHDIFSCIEFIPLLRLHICFPFLIFSVYSSWSMSPVSFPYYLYYILFLLMCLYVQNWFNSKFHLHFSILIFFWCLPFLDSLIACVSSLNSLKTSIFSLSYDGERFFEGSLFSSIIHEIVWCPIPCLSPESYYCWLRLHYGSTCGHEVWIKKVA